MIDIEGDLEAITQAAVDDVTLNYEDDDLASDAIATREEVEDAWLCSPMYEQFSIILQDIKQPNGLRAHKTKRVYTSQELDTWILAKVLVVAKRVSSLWQKDGLLELSMEGHLRYRPRARSSLPVWALGRIDEGAYGLDQKWSSLQQKYQLVILLVLMTRPDWQAAFRQASEQDTPVDLSTFTQNSVNLNTTVFDSKTSGHYVLVEPSGKHGYFGKSTDLASRMKGHARKGVNRYVRRFIADDPTRNGIDQWRKYGVLTLSDEHWPDAIDAIVEPLCIAMGGFTSGEHFNINYFDYAGWAPIVNTFNVVMGWMEIVRQSYLRNPDGTCKLLPNGTKEDRNKWQTRFGEDFGGQLSGRTIQKIATGLDKRKLTKLLPQPKPEAWLVMPRYLEGDASGPTRKRTGDSLDSKPEGHTPHLLQHQPSKKLKALIGSDAHTLAMSSKQPEGDILVRLADRPPLAQDSALKETTVANVVNSRSAGRLAKARSKSNRNTDL